jgi:hypothetical protein
LGEKFTSGGNGGRTSGAIDGSRLIGWVGASRVRICVRKTFQNLLNWKK